MGLYSSNTRTLLKAWWIWDSRYSVSRVGGVSLNFLAFLRILSKNQKMLLWRRGFQFSTLRSYKVQTNWLKIWKIGFFHGILCTQPWPNSIMLQKKMNCWDAKNFCSSNFCSKNKALAKLRRSSSQSFGQNAFFAQFLGLGVWRKRSRRRHKVTCNGVG